MSKLLEINHCRKSFGATEVLKDLTLSVEQSQVLSIIGPSGSGKSTLLRCATLLETMDGGDLIYDGIYAARDAGRFMPPALSCRRFGICSDLCFRTSISFRTIRC